jgi:hypothetical protein
MMTATMATPKAARKPWPSYILSGLVVAFLLMDSVIHIMGIPAVAEASLKLGYPVNAWLPLGLVELACLALYVYPRTSVLGAVLLTGYLGGAIAIHVRVADPLFTHILFPVYLGFMLWGGLYLRDERVQALFPIRSNS